MLHAGSVFFIRLEKSAGFNRWSFPDKADYGLVLSQMHSRHETVFSNGIYRGHKPSVIPFLKKGLTVCSAKKAGLYYGVKQRGKERE
jgi:hypothetical protein